MYTKEQIEEIGKRLGLMGIKDTQFPPAAPIDGTEALAIVQSGRNKLIRVDEFAEELANYISIEKAQSDWLQDIDTAPDYIKNKPLISDKKITINQGNNSWSFTLNQNQDDTIDLANGGGLSDAFSTIQVGTSSAAATGGDTFEFVAGTNVTLALNNKKLTINSKGGGTGGDVGTLSTTSASGLSPAASESFENNIELHKVSKTGNFGDLLGTDNVVQTSSTAGLIKNDGTIDTNSYQTALTEYANYTNAGDSTHVPSITTNNLGQVTNINLVEIDAYTKSQIDFMLETINGRIDAINARLSGITIYASSRTIYVGEEAAIVVNVTCTDTASSMTLYRNNTELHTFGSDNTWTYTDEFTPSSYGTITYKAVATIGGIDKENQISVDVIKRDATLYWSPSSTTAYLNYSDNVYPTLNNPNLLNVTYSSSVAGVATINNSGQVSLVGTGTTIISAIYNGESASSRYNSKTASYTLKVEDDTVTGLSWDKGGTNSYTVNVNGNVNFNRGTVLASWASGKEPTNVTNIATFNTEKSGQGSRVQGTKYYAPTNAGTDVISVSYGNMTAPETVSVTVQRITTNLQWMSNGQSVDEWELTLGETPYSFPDLTGDENLPARLVVYSSNDTNVATIDIYTGEVDVKGAGTCTITASIPANGQYTQSSDSYELTISNPEPGPEPPGPEPPTPTDADYYVGYSMGEHSYDNVADGTIQQLIEMADGFNKTQNPSHTKTITAAEAADPSSLLDIQVLFIMWKANSAPTSGSWNMGMGTITLNSSDFTNSSKFNIQRDLVDSNSVTWHVAGLVSSFDEGNTLTVNFN